MIYVETTPRNDVLGLWIITPSGGDDRFSQYGIKVSFLGSGTLKIVIYVENYPQKRRFRLDDYNPLCGGGC